MARDQDPNETVANMANETDTVEATIRGLSRGDLQSLLQRLLAARAVADGLLEKARPPSRRRPRCPSAVTYRVRIDLKGTRPPVWRRFAHAGAVRDRPKTAASTATS